MARLLDIHQDDWQKAPLADKLGSGAILSGSARGHTFTARASFVATLQHIFMFFLSPSTFGGWCIDGLSVENL